MRQATFNKNWDKLLNYAKGSLLSVYTQDLSHKWAEAQFELRTRSIVIDTSYPPKALIANFLHELGHFHDDHKVSNTEWNLVNTAYHNFNTGRRMTAKQKNRVLQTEIKAWEDGRFIAKLLNIRLGQWYTDYRNLAIFDLKRRLGI